MTRTELRAYIDAGILTLIESYSYGSGRISEWNSDRGNSYPMIWLDEEQLIPGTEIIEGMAPMGSWPIRLHIGRKDKEDSSPAQYNALIDACDLTAQRLIYIYTNTLEGYEDVKITDITRPPFIKKHADRLTGVILSFTLVDPDKTNLC
jgi:hypothetical protein